METNDKTANSASDEESFADMFEKSYVQRGRLEPGQMVETMIVKISGDWIFLDLGGKGEGYLERKEMLDDSGNLPVKEGDRIRAYFLSSKNNEMHFTTKIGSGPGKQSQLEDAWRNGIPVDGTVAKEMKGGFEVKIGGTVRAFVPFPRWGSGAMRTRPIISAGPCHLTLPSTKREAGTSWSPGGPSWIRRNGRRNRH